ncbi:MAG: hypothetical protein ACP5N9_00950 [Candidatus Bilamarchaeum sp.]
MALSVFDTSIKGRRFSASVVPGKESFLDSFVEYLDDRRRASFNQFSLTTDAILVSSQVVRRTPNPGLIFDRQLNARPIGVSAAPYFFGSFEGDNEGYFSRENVHGIPLRFVNFGSLAALDIKEIVQSSIRCVVRSHVNDSGFVIRQVPDSDLIYSSSRAHGSSISIAEVLSVSTFNSSVNGALDLAADLISLRSKFAAIGLISEETFNTELENWINTHADLVGTYKDLLKTRLVASIS